MTRLRQRIAALEEPRQQRLDEAAFQTELRLIIGRLEDLATQIDTGREEADWLCKREMIRALVKRVEVTQDQGDTGGQRQKPRRGGEPVPCGCRHAGGSVIQKRRRSSMARMTTGAGRTRTRRAIAWARRFGPGDQSTGRGRAASTAVRPWRTKRVRRCVRRCVGGRGTCAALSRSRIGHGCATRRCEVGSNTTGDRIARRCIR